MRSYDELKTVHARRESTRTIPLHGSFTLSLYAFDSQNRLIHWNHGGKKREREISLSSDSSSLNGYSYGGVEDAKSIISQRGPQINVNIGQNNIY